MHHRAQKHMAEAIAAVEALLRDYRDNDRACELIGERLDDLSDLRVDLDALEDMDASDFDDPFWRDSRHAIARGMDEAAPGVML